MTARVVVPEQRLLRDVFADELSAKTLAVLAAFDVEPLRRQLRQRIDGALGVLSYRERGVLEMCYGLGDGHAYTLAEAAYVFKLSRKRIAQLRLKAIKKLHRHGEELRSFLGGLER